MGPLGIIIAIALFLIFIWLLMQPKQGMKASNAPRPTIPDDLPDGLPSGEEQPIRASVEDRVVSAPVEDRVVSAPRNPDIDSVFQNEAEVTSSAPSLSLETEVRQFLNAGQKIAAIKRVRELKHWGLKESKDYVESLERNDTPLMPVPQITSEPTPELRQEVQRLLAAHQKVSAVKLVREQTHWHLREAKDYVDAVQAEQMQAMEEAASSALLDQDLQKEILRLIEARQKFAAVERIRRATGWGINQAIEYVSDLERNQSR